MIVPRRRLSAALSASSRSIDRCSPDPAAPSCRIGDVFSAALVSALVLAVPHGWHTIKMNPKLKASCEAPRRVGTSHCGACGATS